MTRHRRTRNKYRKKSRQIRFKPYIPVHSDLEKSNRRDIALLARGWSPAQTKFGEPFKGKNQVLIVEEK